MDELMAVLVAAQELERRYRDNGRPFLAHCARELELELHSLLDAIEAPAIGWAPVESVAAPRNPVISTTSYDHHSPAGPQATLSRAHGLA